VRARLVRRVARELTLKAAEQVGLRPTLLESRKRRSTRGWRIIRTGCSPGEMVLVFDVGGGTTDFSLIAVEGRADLRAHRVAITCCSVATTWIWPSPAASRPAWPKAAARHPQLQMLVQACRVAKERLLGDENRAAGPSPSPAAAPN